MDQPANGVLRDFECCVAGSTLHVRSGSITVTSAVVPVPRVPRSSERSRAGLLVSIATQLSKRLRDTNEKVTYVKKALFDPSFLS